MKRGSASRSYHQTSQSLDLSRYVACEGTRRPRVEGIHLSHVNEPAHEILIAQCADRLLGLLPCCVFHNPTMVSTSYPGDSPLRSTYPHPYRTRGQCPNPSIQRPTTKIKPERPAISTYWRPPSTFHSEVVTHQQKAPPPLWCCVRRATNGGQVRETRLTLPHKVFQVVPLDVVGQITDIDTPFLLRRFSDGRHHLLLSLGTFFKTSGRSNPATTTVAGPRVASRCTAHR